MTATYLPCPNPDCRALSPETANYCSTCGAPMRNTMTTAKRETVPVQPGKKEREFGLVTEIRNIMRKDEIEEVEPARLTEAQKTNRLLLWIVAILTVPYIVWTIVNGLLLLKGH